MHFQQWNCNAPASPPRYRHQMHAGIKWQVTCGRHSISTAGRNAGRHRMLRTAGIASQEQQVVSNVAGERYHRRNGTHRIARPPTCHPFAVIHPPTCSNNGSNVCRLVRPPTRHTRTKMVRSEQRNSRTATQHNEFNNATTAEQASPAVNDEMNGMHEMV